MNTLSTTVCRGFVLCTSAISPNDYYVLDNAGTGKVIQFLYLISGGGTLVFNDGSSMQVDQDIIYDLSQYAGTPIKYWADGRGAIGMAIDPVPSDKRFNHELVKGETNKTIVGTANECIILCLEGTITCNGIELKSTQYAPITEGKTVNVSVPANAAMVILTAR